MCQSSSRGETCEMRDINSREMLHTLRWCVNTCPTDNAVGRGDLPFRRDAVWSDLSPHHDAKWSHLMLYLPILQISSLLRRLRVFMLTFSIQYKFYWNKIKMQFSWFLSLSSHLTATKSTMWQWSLFHHTKLLVKIMYPVTLRKNYVTGPSGKHRSSYWWRIDTTCCLLSSAF